MRLTTDAKIGALLLAFCIVMFVATFWIIQPTYANMSAAVFPRVVLAILTPLCLVLFIRGLRAGAQEGVPPRMNWATFRAGVSHYRLVLIGFGLFFLMVWAMPILGFLVTGTLYLAAMLLLLGPYRPSRIPLILLLSVLFAGAIYVVFYFVLHVIMPSGILL